LLDEKALRVILTTGGSALGEVCRGREGDHLVVFVGINDYKVYQRPEYQNKVQNGEKPHPSILQAVGRLEVEETRVLTAFTLLLTTR